MTNRKPVRPVVLLMMARIAQDRKRKKAAAEPVKPSFQAALLGDAVMHPDCSAVPDAM
jgi:hypothetical protein